MNSITAMVARQPASAGPAQEIAAAAHSKYPVGMVNVGFSRCSASSF